MNHSIILSPEERKHLLAYLRHAPDPELRLRAHIILLLADGFAWSLIGGVLYCSSRTIARWKARFTQGRVEALRGKPRGAPPLPKTESWIKIVADWVTQQTPQAFGFFRSRWCCTLLVVLLWREHAFAVSRETVRRWLHRAELVWRRPRPVLERQDPQREVVLAELRQLLLHLPDDETVVFQDEVDVNLNPKLGSMWMRQGQQARVVTPGDNAKSYLAGSLHWRTGVLLVTPGAQRDGTLFVAHLHDLRRRLRRYTKVHVICDNARFHWNCWAVWDFCHRHGERIVLHFLPKYAPECNPVERVWWHLHEEITRNHQYKSLPELVEAVLQWLKERKSFAVEDSVYQLKLAS